MLYSVVSYVPSVNKKLTGAAVIQVTGCALQTSIDIAYGVVQGSAAWNATVDPVVAGIIDAMDPNSESYDPTLIGGG